MRPLPQVTPWTEWFWTSGKDGTLRIQGCADCARLVHPPTARCPHCGSTSSQPTAVSGRATVAGFSANHQQWLADFPPPYVVAVVCLEEDADVRLTTNVVNCEPDAVRVGQRVQVVFEEQDGVWLPLFDGNAK